MVLPSLHTTCWQFCPYIYLSIINNDPYQVQSSMDYYYSAAATSNPSSSGSSSVPRNGKERKKVSGNKGGNNGVKLSTDPQSVAARERRHRISDRFKILQSLVPGGTKMDTVSMLEEAINYVKFLKNQIMLHQTLMQLMADHDHGPDNHDCSLVCPPAAAAAAGSTTTLPGDHDQQATSYLDIGSFVAEVQPSSNSLPCPDSYFQGENDTMHLIYRNN